MIDEDIIKRKNLNDDEEPEINDKKDLQILDTYTIYVKPGYWNDAITYLKYQPQYTLDAFYCKYFKLIITSLPKDRKNLLIDKPSWLDLR